MAQPFFNTNYRVASTAPAAALIAQTGQTQGQMFANMGKQIGGMIEQYGLNKQKRDESEAAFQGKFGRISEQPGGAEKILAMQNDPVIGPTLKRIQDGKGTQKDFDKFNAFTSADTEQEIQLMRRRAMESDIATKLLENENKKLRNEIGQRTRDDVIEGVKADTSTKKARAGMAETEQAYQKENFDLTRRNIESLIKSRDINTLSQFYRMNNVQAPIPEDSEKRYSEISTLLPKLDNTMVKVKTTGFLGINSEEKEIPYKEYKENPDDFAPLSNDQIKGLEMKEQALKNEQSELLLKSPYPFVNNDTGERGMTTVGEMLNYLQNKPEPNVQTRPQSIPLGEEDLMMLDQPGTTMGMPQVLNPNR